MIGILIIGFVKNNFCHCPQHHQSTNYCSTCHRWDSLKELATSIFVNKNQSFINFKGLHNTTRDASSCEAVSISGNQSKIQQCSMSCSILPKAVRFIVRNLHKFQWWLHLCGICYILNNYMHNILEMEAKFIATTVVNVFGKCTFKAKNL
jgi:hypothetical protein